MISKVFANTVAALSSTSGHRNVQYPRNTIVIRDSMFDTTFSVPVVVGTRPAITTSKVLSTPLSPQRASSRFKSEQDVFNERSPSLTETISSSSQFSTTSTIKKTVQFHDRALLHVAKHSLSDIEKEMAFYSAKELSNIERDAWNTIVLANNAGKDSNNSNRKKMTTTTKTADLDTGPLSLSIPLPHDDCLRGLETYPHTRGYKIALMTRKKAIQTVLKEQKRMRKAQKRQKNTEQNPFDMIETLHEVKMDEYIENLSHLYAKVTRMDKINAIQMAKQDAEFLPQRIVPNSSSDDSHDENNAMNALFSPYSVQQERNIIITIDKTNKRAEAYTSPTQRTNNKKKSTNTSSASSTQKGQNQHLQQREVGPKEHRKNIFPSSAAAAPVAARAGVRSRTIENHSIRRIPNRIYQQIIIVLRYKIQLRN